MRDNKNDYLKKIMNLFKSSSFFSVYAEVVLKMCTAAFNAAWNEKLASARRTQKRLNTSS